MSAASQAAGRSVSAGGARGRTVGALSEGEIRQRPAPVSSRHANTDGGRAASTGHYRAKSGGGGGRKGAMEGEDGTHVLTLNTQGRACCMETEALQS